MPSRWRWGRRHWPITPCGLRPAAGAAEAAGGELPAEAAARPPWKWLRSGRGMSAFRSKPFERQQYADADGAESHLNSEDEEEFEAPPRRERAPAAAAGGDDSGPSDDEDEDDERPSRRQRLDGILGAAAFGGGAPVRQGPASSRPRRKPRRSAAATPTGKPFRFAALRASAARSPIVWAPSTSLCATTLAA